MAPQWPDWTSFSIRIPEPDIDRVPGTKEEYYDQAVEMGQKATSEWEKWFAPEVLFHHVGNLCEELLAQGAAPSFRHPILTLAYRMEHKVTSFASKVSRRIKARIARRSFQAVSFCMKVFHVNEHQTLKGGVETYLYSLIPHLHQQEIRCVVAYGKGDASLYDPSYAVPAIGQVGFSMQKQARQQLGRVLRDERPDVIHLHNVQNVGVLQACLNYGPTVLTTHDYRWVCPANTFFYKRTQEVCGRSCGLGCFTTTLSEHCVTPRPQYAGYFYYRTRWAIRHASEFAHVIAPSDGAANRYEQGGFSSASISVLPYFCSIRPADAPRALPEQKTITFLGRIAPNKGHEYFITALGALPANVRGVMVGNIGDNERSRLLELAREQGCDNRLELRPWASRKEVIELLDQTSVFVFPSLWPETLGIVGIEALSRGVPVVASDIGGVREWCLDGETGYVVPPKDAAAIAGRVQDLLSDSDRMLAFGRRGIELIQEKFSPEYHVNQLQSIYGQVAKARDTSTGAYV